MKKLLLYSSLALYGVMSVGCSKDLNEGGATASDKDYISISSVSLAAGTENVTGDGAQIKVINTVNKEVNTYSYIDAAWQGSNPAFGWTDPYTYLRGFVVKPGMGFDDITFPITNGVVDQSKDASACDYMYYESSETDYVYADIVATNQEQKAAIELKRLGAKVVFLVKTQQFAEGKGGVQSALIKSAPGLEYIVTAESGIGGAWVAKPDQVNVKANIETRKNSVSAIISPVEKWTPNAIFTIDGKQFSTNTLQDNIEVAPLAAGKLYTFEVTISKNYGLIAISLSDITDWDDTYNIQGESFEGTDNGRLEPWNGSAYGGYNSGSGTELDPYIINIPGQLAQLGADSDTDGKYYKVADSSVFDMNNLPWIPIGNEAVPFKGKLDGNGLVIKNVTCDSLAGAKHLGLFGYIEGATISNLTVDSAVVVNNANEVGYYTAVLVGASNGAADERSIISNCRVINSSVETIYVGTSGKMNRVAGIAASIENTLIENCHVAKSSFAVTGGTDLSSNGGGIAAAAGTTPWNIIACTVDSTTITAYNAAGILTGAGTQAMHDNYLKSSIAGCAVGSATVIKGGKHNTFTGGIIASTYFRVYGCYSMTNQLSGAGWTGNQNGALVGKFTEYYAAGKDVPELLGTDFFFENYTTTALPPLYAWSSYDADTNSWGAATYDKPSVNASGNNVSVGEITDVEVAAMNSAITTVTDALELPYSYEYVVATDGSSLPYIPVKIEPALPY